MIPKIIHQTWKSEQIPAEFQEYVQSWEAKNPTWERMFWTDRALLDFVTDHYPDFLSIFTGYSSGVMRADAGRYLLLHHFGGVYADLDCECVNPIDRIMQEDRIVVCKEPALHIEELAHWRAQPYFLFNGTIASPKGHPFWLHLLKYLRMNSNVQKDVLDITGPSIFTAAQLSYQNQDAFAIHDANLFAPLDKNGSGRLGPETLSIHHWAGTWWTPKPAAGWQGKLKDKAYKLRYMLSRGTQFDASDVVKEISPLADTPLPPADGKIAIFIPVRNAADHISPLGELLTALEIPRDRLRIVFCEGDSSDRTAEALAAFTKKYSGRFSDITVLKRDVGNSLNSDKRHLKKYQRVRRGNIAKVRNHLIQNGLNEDDDWVLWLDADVCDFPANIVTKLLAAKGKIVTPNCVKTHGGTSFDKNNFIDRILAKDYRYFRNVKDGLYQPPPSISSRYHLSDLRHLPKVQLDAVGGTMLLVDASLHRAGLVFPEQPYEDLIETEAFGVLANHCGLKPIGLPSLEIRHVPW